VAGAKDDRLDARVLADSLRTDGPLFRRLRVDAPEVIELREWSRMDGELKEERTRLANRAREQLRRYYPQVLALGGDVTEEWVLALWERAPTPDDGARLRESSIRAVLARHRVRRIDPAQAVRVLRERPLVVAPGTAQAAVAHLRMLLPRLRLVAEQIARCEQRLAAMLQTVFGDDPGQKGEQRDAAILRSLPGVGRVVLATLLSEASRPLAERDYHTLRALCGVAPVTKQSGKRRVVIMRQACHPRLREALYHWSRVATQCDPRSRIRYAALRGRGHTHGRALRTVGDRLLELACTLLQRRERFDPERYAHPVTHAA
jgi:transposase